MNGRAALKRLMKSRQRVLWGPRAFLSVRVPLAAYPEPYPAWTPPGAVDCFVGHWSRQEGDRISGAIQSAAVASPRLCTATWTGRRKPACR